MTSELDGIQRCSLLDRFYINSIIRTRFENVQNPVFLFFIFLFFKSPTEECVTPFVHLYMICRNVCHVERFCVGDICLVVVQPVRVKTISLPPLSHQNKRLAAIRDRTRDLKIFSLTLSQLSYYSCSCNSGRKLLCRIYRWQ